MLVTTTPRLVSRRRCESGMVRIRPINTVQLISRGSPVEGFISVDLVCQSVLSSNGLDPSNSRVEIFRSAAKPLSQVRIILLFVRSGDQ